MLIMQWAHQMREQLTVGVHGTEHVAYQQVAHGNCGCHQHDRKTDDEKVFESYFGAFALCYAGTNDVR